MVHAGGRPTLYNEEMLSRAQFYVDEFDKSEGERILIEEYIPTREGLSDFLKVAVDTIEAWTNEYPEFSATYTELKSKQAKLLQNGGIKGKFKEGMSKFLLSAVHGMKEKTEVDNKLSGSISLTKLFEESHNP